MACFNHIHASQRAVKAVKGPKQPRWAGRASECRFASFPQTSDMSRGYPRHARRTRLEPADAEHQPNFSISRSRGTARVRFAARLDLRVHCSAAHTQRRPRSLRVRLQPRGTAHDSAASASMIMVGFASLSRQVLERTWVQGRITSLAPTNCSAVEHHISLDPKR